MRIPLYVEIKGRRILVIGGGRVGTRRALKFLKAGARVTVVSLEFSQTLLKENASNEKLVLIKADASEAPSLEKLVGESDLVVIATNDPKANKAAAIIARSLGKPVNNATNAADSDVVVPFEVEVGGIRVSVTTEGRSGIAARIAATRIKEMLEADEDLKTLFKAMEKAKKYLKASIRDPKIRIPIYFEIEKDPEFRLHVARHDPEAAWKRAKNIIDLRASEHP